MKNVMSVRLDAKALRRIRELARREKKEMSSVARELMEYGWVFLMLREYGEGKISLGTLADRLGVPLAEAFDLLAELGVRSPIEFDDYLKSYAASVELFKR
jgi:hypothetical protein